MLAGAGRIAAPESFAETMTPDVQSPAAADSSAEPSGLVWLVRISSVLLVMLTALAAGAAWSVLQVRVGHDMIGLAPVIAIIIAWVVRQHGWAGCWQGALLATTATLLACTYAQLLLAAVSVAMFVGESVRSTLFRIGFEMAMAVAWVNATVVHISVVAFAAVLSAWLVLRSGARREVAER